MTLYIVPPLPPLANLQLVVATRAGVITTVVGPQNSSVCVTSDKGSSGVAFDSHTDTAYWVTEGNRGMVVSRTVGNVATPSLYTVSNAFALRLDWVTRRLFWVQDGTEVNIYSDYLFIPFHGELARDCATLSNLDKIHILEIQKYTLPSGW